MRSSECHDNDHPLHFAKHFFGSGFFGGAISLVSVEIVD